MEKTQERLALEEKLRGAHFACFPIADKIAQEKYRKNYGELSIGEEIAILAEVREAIKHFWEIYAGGQDKLFELEKQEGFPAFRAYAKHIDFVGANLPPQNRSICYHPFSGLDFLWARIFQKTIFEDIAFNLWHPLFGWWKAEDYSADKRMKIIHILKKERIIPSSAVLEFIKGDSRFESGQNEDLNNPDTTLFLKRGHDNLIFLKKRFLDLNQELMFGAIFFESGFYEHSIEGVEKVLASQNYKLALKYKYSGVDLEYSIPYALGPGKHNAIFIKKS